MYQLVHFFHFLSESFALCCADPVELQPSGVYAANFSGLVPSFEPTLSVEIGVNVVAVTRVTASY